MEVEGVEGGVGGVGVGEGGSVGFVVGFVRAGWGKGRHFGWGFDGMGGDGEDGCL